MVKNVEHHDVSAIVTINKAKESEKTRDKREPVQISLTIQHNRSSIWSLTTSRPTLTNSKNEFAVHITINAEQLSPMTETRDIVSFFLPSSNYKYSIHNIK